MQMCGGKLLRRRAGPGTSRATYRAGAPLFASPLNRFLRSRTVLLGEFVLRRWVQPYGLVGDAKKRCRRLGRSSRRAFVR